MKIMIINVSGNVGKTTLVKHLFSPRMQNAKVVVFENTNAGVDELVDPIQLQTDDFVSLVDILALEDEVIVDLGASEAKDMIRKLKEYESAIHEFDQIIVPVLPDAKAQEDTLATVMTLAALGVESNKIRILFNKVPIHQSSKIAVVFEPLLQSIGAMATIDFGLVVFQFEIYNSLKGGRTTVSDVVKDKTDWKAIARDGSNFTDEQRLHALSMNRNQKAGPPAHRNLDAVFARLCAQT